MLGFDWARNNGVRGCVTRRVTRGGRRMHSLRAQSLRHGEEVLGQQVLNVQGQSWCQWRWPVLIEAQGEITIS